MIQHTYDVQTFDDGNKIIRPALSNEYEALLGCLIDFPDLMERSVDIVIDGEAEIYNTAGNVFSADIEIAGPLSQVFCLGVLAQRLNRKLVFDRETKQITNDPFANQMLVGEAPRKGWEQYYNV